MNISVFLELTIKRLRLKYGGLALMLVFMQACQYGLHQELNVTQDKLSPLNTRFNINQQDIALFNGYAEESAAPDSNTKLITQVWGTPTITDLNGDGQQDAVLILSQNGVGSGIFYYLVVAIREGEHFKGSKAFLLGDRIQPHEVRVDKNRITVQLLDRLKSDAYTTLPSITTEQRFVYDADTQQLIAVEPNFAGEADPARMTLGMKTWYWEKTQYNNDSEQKPKLAQKFSLKFEANGKVLITTDCNAMQGEFSVTDNQITLSKMISTRMFCADSQEQEFSKMLTNVSSYFFTGKGRLILELKYDSGSMTFW